MAKKLNSPRKSTATAKSSTRIGGKSSSAKLDVDKPSKQVAKSASKPAVKSVKTTKEAAGKSLEKSSEKPKKGKAKGRTAQSGSTGPAGKGEISEPPDFEILDYEEAGQELKELEAFEAEHLEGGTSDLLDSEAAGDVGGTGAQTEEISSEIQPKEDEIILTDAEGRRLCRVRECDQAATVEAYCRFHYLQNWKRIQIRRKILSDGKLARYVDELTSRYPDKFLETIRKDLQTEKEFMMAIAELEIDENGADSDFEDEGQNFIDEVRGVSDATISEDEEF